MRTFQVTITETLQTTIPIEANSRTEAERQAERRWRNSEYVWMPTILQGCHLRFSRPSKSVNTSDERCRGQIMRSLNQH